MRYTVMYDDLVKEWAVVDTKAAGMAIGFHDKEDEARDAASAEEERRNKGARRQRPPTRRRA